LTLALEVSMQGKAGLVTDAAGGNGRATAVALSGAGACVGVSDLARLRSGGDETCAVPKPYV
jgi:NAD(P)-dependent dehydrogenase (short-subunit alcohol dehydrogenase family)